MNAAVREVELRAVEPGCPLDAAGRVDDTIPAPGEHEPEVVDHLRPESLRLLDRDPVEVAIALHAEASHESRHICLLEELR